MILRRSIAQTVREEVEGRGLSFEVVHCPDSQGGRQMYRIDGTDYTPGDAADKYLPGGFDANFAARLNA